MSQSISTLKLKVLSKISHVIHNALDLEQTLHDILRILSENLSMKRATVTLIDQQTGQLLITASYGLTQEEKNRGVYRLDEGVTGRIFQSAQPYYVPDIRKEPLFLDKTGSRSIEKGRVSFIGVPIILSGTPIGVLNVDRLFGDDVSYEEDIDFLTVVATLIAQFISLNQKVKATVDELRRENVSLKYQLSREARRFYIVGKSNAMLEVENQIEKVAPTKATVLLLGESGTGKTLIARIIHEISERAKFPFIKVNCASIPDNLLEAELFGYVRGAFTGAEVNKQGRFEAAHKGTIFLDEVGELPLGIQAKLLRVLQEREFKPVGCTKAKKSDVRLIAATNKDLEVMVKEGAFRKDLYYRLNIVPIFLYPLRERREDIPILANDILQREAMRMNRRVSRFTKKYLDLLLNYGFPGNVQELNDIVATSIINAESKLVGISSLAHYMRDILTSGRRSLMSFRPRKLKDVVRDHVARTVLYMDGDRGKAAGELDIKKEEVDRILKNA